MTRRQGSAPTTLAAGIALAVGAAAAQADTVELRFVTQFTSPDPKAPIEEEFVQELQQNKDLDLAVDYVNMHVLGIQEPDALRLLRSGAFDLMSVQIGRASRDDPFFEGLDLVGVSTTVPELREAVDAYREVFDERLQRKFNAKVLTLWPFGTQIFYCNAPIESLDDLEGLKVRTFTPSMSALVEYLGASPVTLQFNEVYPALQRGVASCAITSPTSGNSGKWPEVTTHQLPVSVAGSVQGHFINLDKWNEFTADEQAVMEAEFKELEDRLWELASTLNQDAINCNTGQEPCEIHQKYDMTLVEVSEEDRAKIKEAVTAAVLPTWAEKCNSIDPECGRIWNGTVGEARGFEMPE